MKKILFIPPEPWYVENHIEYLIRYLGHKYIMELAFCPPMPFEEGVKADPLKRNPDDYDLLVPLRPTHGQTGYPPGMFVDKVAFILWEPNEGRFKDSLINACTTPLAVRSMERAGHPYMHVSPGIDLNLFQPGRLAREEDGKLHVGVVGCAHNPRHKVKEVVLPLLDIPGVVFDFFVRNWRNQGTDLGVAGGEKFFKHIHSGNKRWVGVPNVYNRMDVLLKVDYDPGLTFPILEAAACEIPFVTTHVGIEEDFRDAGIVLDADEKDDNGNGRQWYTKNTDKVIERVRKAIIWMRDHPKEKKVMGETGRRIVYENYTWELQIPKWEKFFNKALKMAEEAK